MGGKKKKSLANKLAKMSDEERARYLQHRAEIEEEAKRRKEQLIATFMKKKIKKEEAFARLNMAKINQSWHQLMRKIKVKQMKDEVEHLKTWIERGLTYKNRHIQKLMEELDEAEEQYLNNFNCHTIHVDRILENQNLYMEQLQNQQDQDLEGLLEQARKEEGALEKYKQAELEYLKTVTFAQGKRDIKELRASWEYYSKMLYEVEYNNNTQLNLLRKSRSEAAAVIWRQIWQVVRYYVDRTDATRSHLQELRRMDGESAEEIRRNEEKIAKEDDLIKTLTVQHQDLLQHQAEKIKSLEAEQTELNSNFLHLRKTLKNHLELDEKKLRLLTSTSNDVLDHLNIISTKGRHVVNLSETCCKYETEREKILRWMPMVEVEEDEDEEIKDTRTDDEKLETKSFLDSCCANLQKLEGFWRRFNKTEVDVMELKQEKCSLEKQNKQLRGLIRTVLEAAALARAPDSGYSTRLQSKRSSYSAPLRKMY